jgi:hypothetical protein
MQKTVKKLDNNVVRALTQVCETAKQKVPGFNWLTHRADYANFPASLVVTCVFNSRAEVDEVRKQELDIYLRKLIQGSLLRVGVVLKDARRNMVLDSEESCMAEHQGDWTRRLG